MLDVGAGDKLDIVVSDGWQVDPSGGFADLYPLIDADLLAADPAFRALRDELLGLFYMDEDEEPRAAGERGGARE